MDLEGFKGWKVFTPNFRLPCSSSGNGALSCSAPSAGLCYTWDFLLFLTLYPLSLLSFKSCCKAFPLEVITCGFFFSQQFSTTVLKCGTCVPAPKMERNLLGCRHQASGFPPGQVVLGCTELKVLRKSLTLGPTYPAELPFYF